MKYLLFFLSCAALSAQPVTNLQFIRIGSPDGGGGNTFYEAFVKVNNNFLQLSNQARIAQTNQTDITNLIASTVTSTSNSLQRAWYTNYTVHRPTDSITTISNRLRANSSNWVHYFETGVYPCVSTYDNDNSARQGTFVVKNARNLKLQGIGTVTFLVTNSMSPTGAITCSNIQEPLFPGNIFVFEDFDTLEFRDINIVYQRTNYHGHCAGLSSDAIFIGGTNVIDYRFINVTIDGAPNQGIQSQTADYVRTRAWTNGLIDNCRFVRIGSTNFNGGVGGVSNPTQVKDGTAVYAHKNTRIQNCYFEQNLRDIELEGTATDTSYPTFYTGFLSHNRHVNWRESAVILVTSTNINSVLIHDNIFEHTNTVYTSAISGFYAINTQGDNVVIHNNIIKGGVYGAYVGIGTATIPGNIIFRDNLCVSNVNAFACAYSSTPGTVRLPSIYIDNNVCVATGNRVFIVEYARNVFIRNNTSFDSNTQNTSSEDIRLGYAGATSVMTNIVITGNTFIKTNSNTRTAPIYFNACISNANIVYFDNTVRDNAANSVHQELNDEFAPLSTLTNRPTAASLMYTNNAAENTINAVAAIGATSAISVLVWERNFGNTSAFTTKKYGPYYNANAAEMWVPLNIPLPSRAVFTISNETSIGASGIFTITNWAIVRK